MSFEEFAENVRNDISDYLLGYNIEKISLVDVKKNNAVELKGLVIKSGDSNIAPNIYLEDYYQQYITTGDMDEVLRNIKNNYDTAYNSIIKNNVTYNMQKENIFYRLVNYDYNRDMFDNSPYVMIAPDLALSLRVMVSKDDNGIASALLTYDMLEKFGISKTEAYDMAKENTERLFPAKVEKLSNIIQSKEIDTTGMLAENMLYIVTNDTSVNGASAMCYENVLKEFKEQYGDFYILPSSIHEVLLLRKSELPEDNLSEIKQMVKDINKYCLLTEEKLSDNVYEYDEKTNEIIIAGEQRQREDFMER